jgi:nicotinamide mononucleotide (NMN) deamidase PncC
VSQWLAKASAGGEPFSGGIVVRNATSLRSLLGIENLPEDPADAKVAEAMAWAIRARTGADFGLGVAAFPQSGVEVHTATAGPRETGERTGTLQVALASSDKVRSKGFPLASHPAITKTRAAKQALNMLRLALLNRETSK